VGCSRSAGRWHRSSKVGGWPGLRLRW
jgi:hypothetical protein